MSYVKIHAPAHLFGYGHEPVAKDAQLYGVEVSRDFLRLTRANHNANIAKFRYFGAAI